MILDRRTGKDGESLAVGKDAGSEVVTGQTDDAGFAGIDLQMPPAVIEVMDVFGMLDKKPKNKGGRDDFQTIMGVVGSCFVGRVADGVCQLRAKHQRLDYRNSQMVC